MIELVVYPLILKNLKKRGVFVQEYTAYPNPYTIYDTIQITVHEAWLEQQWQYSKYWDSIRSEKNTYQLCLNTNNNDMMRINGTWLIGAHHCPFGLNDNNILTCDFYFYIPNDTLMWEIQGGSLINDSANKIIGQFTLIKKN